MDTTSYTPEKTQYRLRLLRYRDTETLEATGTPAAGQSSGTF